ncbi:carbonic anhydrase 2-like [Ctenocephalides felis]|uniref:carbonic anhydrase 2-like n=1 Tax=Ctenocephalides felis TaxID=7515 RepID=UPI000E6E2B07|nr:carbonic anhydrase 2-like [Ctenocephalides felis]
MLTKSALFVFCLTIALNSFLAEPVPEALVSNEKSGNQPIVNSPKETVVSDNSNFLKKALHRFGFGNQPVLGQPGNETKSKSSGSRKQTRGGSDFSYDDTSYNGPSQWKNFAPECGGIRQSPIAIEKKDLVVASVWKTLQWNDFSRLPSAMELVNNGHSVQLSATYFGGRRPTISHGPLVGDYTFEQLHFHWGGDDQHGSEHVVNGVQYPMECHLVHWKSEYGSMGEALKHTDGVAVVAFMFDSKEDKDNAGLAKIISKFSEVGSGSGPAVGVQAFPLTDLIRPFVDNYATYTGSLTTPPCTEAVTWIIASQTQQMSKSQMAKIREVRGPHGPISGNFRPTQPLNGRTVYYIPY